jgi:hypothetical protein
MENSFECFKLQLAEFINLSCDGYAILSTEDILLCTNKAFADLLFRPEDELIGQNFANGISHAKRTAYRH